MDKKTTLEYLKDEWLLTLLLVGTLLTTIYLRRVPVYSVSDAETLFTLLVLLVLTNGLKQHRVLEKVTSWIERGKMLPVKLVLATFVFSALVTNDAALLAIIPITLSLQIAMKEWVVILEALAANAGSAISPIGNPQNIFLYWHYEISFWQFVKVIAPFSAFFLLALSLIAAWLSTKSSTVKEINFDETIHLTAVSYFYAGALVVFIFVILRMLPFWLGVVILLGVLAVEKCRLRVDYGLLATFVLFFGLTDNIQFLFATMLAHPHHVFLLSSSLSQIISNVPAALLLADFTPHWQALLWGVSVGGFGSMVGSLANLITYRLYQKQESTEQHFAWKFHAMSYVAFFAGWLLYGVYFRLAG